MTDTKNDQNDTQKDTNPPGPPPEPEYPKDVNALLEKVRKEERTRHQQIIEAEKQRVALAKAEADALKERLALAEAKNQTPPTPKPEPPAPVDLGKVAEEIEAKLAPRFQAADAKITALETENKRLKLQEYRRAKIAEVGAANVVEALVTGDSETAIDTALISAQAEMKRIKEIITGVRPSPTPAPSAAGNGEPTTSSDAGAGRSNEDTEDQLTAGALKVDPYGDPKEFRKNMAALKKTASQVMGQRASKNFVIRGS